VGNKPLGLALALTAIGTLPPKSLAQSNLHETPVQNRQALVDSSEISHRAA